MNPGRATTIAAYARAIEREWSAFVGDTVILSPRDWALIEDWHSRGIRLEIVREAIDAARERAKARSRRAPPRGLGYIAAAVDESWSAVRDGRVARASSPDDPSAERPGSDLGGRFRRRAESEPDGSALASLLLGLALRFERGEAADAIESALDEALPSVVPEAWMGEATEEVRRRIARFRERMEPAAYASTLRRATVDLLRRRAGLSRTD